MNSPELKNLAMNTLDINQIKQYLPHRYPLLLVDRVLHWESGKRITAIKNVPNNQEPHKPNKPNVMMIEALAQTAALLSFLTIDKNPWGGAGGGGAGGDAAR